MLIFIIYSQPLPPFKGEHSKVYDRNTIRSQRRIKAGGRVVIQPSVERSHLLKGSDTCDIVAWSCHQLFPSWGCCCCCCWDKVSVTDHHKITDPLPCWCRSGMPPSVETKFQMGSGIARRLFCLLWDGRQMMPEKGPTVRGCEGCGCRDGGWGLGRGKMHWQAADSGGETECRITKPSGTG